MMRIEFREQGGVGFFPGLHEPVVIDVSALPDAAAAELVRLIAALPADVSPSAPVTTADGRRYTVVVDDGTTVRRIEAADPIPDPAVGALVKALRRHARSQRRANHQRRPTNDR